MAITTSIPPVRNFKSKRTMPNFSANTAERTPGAASSNPGLLGAIYSTIESVGEGLNEDELTRLLLLDAQLPTEAGFTFLSISGGVVTLSVPQQDLAEWYPAKGWVAPEKEKIARAIADKYQLSLCEPPDLASSFCFPSLDPANVHHHLELVTRRETVVIAHPKYLKIRLYREVASDILLMHVTKRLELGPELLQDLSDLYRA